MRPSRIVKKNLCRSTVVTFNASRYYNYNFYVHYTLGTKSAKDDNTNSNEHDNNTNNNNQMTPYYVQSTPSSPDFFNTGSSNKSVFHKVNHFRNQFRSWNELGAFLYSSYISWVAKRSPYEGYIPQHNPNKEERNKGDDDKSKTDDKNSSSGNNSNKNSGTETTFIMWINIIFILSFFYWIVSQNRSLIPAGATLIDWLDFKNVHLPSGNVSKLEVVSKNLVRVHFKDSSKSAQTYFTIPFDIPSFEDKLMDAQRDLGKQPFDYIPVIHNKLPFGNSFRALAPVGLVGALFLTYFVVKRMGIFKFNIGNPFSPSSLFGSKIKTMTTVGERPKVKFEDVAGLDEAKQEIMEFVSFLKEPTKYTKLGGRIPKGALLVGPPGTGKTLLAKATAGEADVPFLYMSSSDFIEMYGGVGSSRVRELFKKARELAPSIVFLDEIDSIGSKRRSSRSHEEKENTLNSLLVEMDGFESQPADKAVVVLAGTNRASSLDPALTRPGRFDRQVSVGVPDIVGRVAILKVHLKEIKLKIENEEQGLKGSEWTSDNIVKSFVKRLSELTPGFSGADIANVCNEGALFAARRGKKYVELIDFEDAIERVIGGLERSDVTFTVQERQKVALHEVGHAVVSWALKHSSPLVKISIRPRGKGLGYNLYSPIEKNLKTKEELMTDICVSLGGRAAENIFYGEGSTGASDDLRKVTQYAYYMIQKCGMSEKVGRVNLHSSGEFELDKMYSEKTGEIIDDEVRSLIKGAYEKTERILREQKEGVIKLARLLLERDVLRNDDLLGVLGPRPTNY